MSNIKLKAGVHYQLTKMNVADKVKEFQNSERGEIGSWLILAAFLAVLAGFAATELNTFLRGKIGDITGSGATPGG